MTKVYTNDGHCLGEEWVNLAGLQLDTKRAIAQLIYLDKTIDVFSERLSNSRDKAAEALEQ